MNRKGFSLVELLVVVAIIGLLAAIAIPQYQRFLWKGIRAEAILTLNAIHKGQMSYFASTDVFAWGLNTVVHPKLGLELGGKTANGWWINNYVPPTDCIAGVKACYSINVYQDLDQNNLEMPATTAFDIFALKYQSTYLDAWNVPDGGVPFHFHDDILNKYVDYP